MQGQKQRESVLGVSSVFMQLYTEAQTREEEEAPYEPAHSWINRIALD